jgi:hypothetical protein
VFPVVYDKTVIDVLATAEVENFPTLSSRG